MRILAKPVSLLLSVVFVFYCNSFLGLLHARADVSPQQRAPGSACPQSVKRWDRPFGAVLRGREAVGYHVDGQLSTRQLTDAAAQVTDSYTYDAFGVTLAQTGSTANAYLYTGEQLDPNVGFYYLRARYMNQVNGRFISADIFPGLEGDASSLHKYLYANAQPVSNRDPSGYFTLLTTLATVAIVAIIAGSLGYAIGGQIVGARITLLTIELGLAITLSIALPDTIIGGVIGAIGGILAALADPKSDALSKFEAFVLGYLSGAAANAVFEPTLRFKSLIALAAIAFGSAALQQLDSLLAGTAKDGFNLLVPIAAAALAIMFRILLAGLVVAFEFISVEAYKSLAKFFDNAIQALLSLYEGLSNIVAEKAIDLFKKAEEKVPERSLPPIPNK